MKSTECFIGSDGSLKLLNKIHCKKGHDGTGWQIQIMGTRKRKAKAKTASETAVKASIGSNLSATNDATKPTLKPGRCKSFKEALDSSMKRLDNDLRELAR